MNILPHKSWHVRTKKNIARVRKDEAEAAEKEKEVQRRIQLAAQESRTSFLRDRANQRVAQNQESEELPITLSEIADLTQGNGHINFFQDLEAGMKLDSEVNKEHEEEKKKEQEDYEKKIGYLVYLGQNSLEQTKDRPWYESGSVARPNEKPIPETDPAHLKMTKFKDFEDPLKDIRKSLATPGVKKIMDAHTASSSTKRKSESSHSHITTETSSKKKKHKSHHKSKSKKKKSKKEKKKSSRRKSDSGESDSDSSEDEKKKRLDKLRAERLEREREERRKAEKLLATLRGDDKIDEQSTSTLAPVKSSYAAPNPMKQKYNSQFNPHLARQNYDD